MPMDQLILMFARTLGRTVVDKTGLAGKYDVETQWTLDQALPPRDGPPAKIDLTGVLLTAIPEQLGLRLESQRGPVEIFFIDSAEKPGEN